MKIYNGLIKILEYIGALVVGAAAIIYFAQVFFRFVVNSSLSWSDEVSGHLVVVMAFLGSALALHDGKHIGMDIMVKSMKKSSRRAFEFISDVLVLGFCAAVVYYGTVVASKSMKFTAATYPMPLGVVYSVIPAGFLVMGIIVIVKMISRLKED